MTVRAADPEVVERARTWAAQQASRPYPGIDPATLARIVRQVRAFEQLPRWRRWAMARPAYWRLRGLRFRVRSLVGSCS